MTRDHLGDFLIAFAAYLDGKLDYADLPQFPSARRSGDPVTEHPYRTTMPKTLTESRLDSLESDGEYRRSEILKWSSRTTWHMIAIAGLVALVAALLVSVTENTTEIKDLKRRMAVSEQAVCEMRGGVMVGGESGAP